MLLKKDVSLFSQLESRVMPLSFRLDFMMVIKTIAVNRIPFQSSVLMIFTLSRPLQSTQICPMMISGKLCNEDLAP